MSFDILTLQLLAHHASHIPLAHSDHAGGGPVGQEAAPLAVDGLDHGEPAACIGEMHSSLFFILSYQSFSWALL